MKKCPFCAEEIQDEAIVCPHCQRSLESKPSGCSIVLIWARNIIGVLQSITLLAGCGGLLIPSSIMLSSAIQWFIILLVMQVVILILIFLVSRGDKARAQENNISLTITHKMLHTFYETGFLELYVFKPEWMFNPFWN